MRNSAAMLDGKSLKQSRKAWNGEQTSKSKGDRKTYGKVTWMHLYAVKILPNRRGPDRGAVGDRRKVTHAVWDNGLSNFRRRLVRCGDPQVFSHEDWGTTRGESCCIQGNVSIGW